MSRILIIDHDDSFTYNLVDLIATLTGSTPDVISHRSDPAALGALTGYDAVVISPGPGTPKNAGDIGISSRVLAEVPIPLLGVCLGHEALALACGGTIGQAAEPRHGRTSTLSHTGTGVFTGVPAGTEVVRYHSLTVTDPGPHLNVTARAEDGTIMGLAHRSRPAWSVQFHPESIATAAGRQILANFLALAADWNATHRPEHDSHRAADPSPSAERTPAPEAAAERTPAPGAAAGPAADGSGAPVAGELAALPGLRLVHQTHPLTVPAEAVFTGVFADSTHAFWLDSRDPAHPDGRFSILGDASGPLAHRVTADVPAGTLTITGPAGEQTITSGFFDWLAGEETGMQKIRSSVELPETGCGFVLGWIGSLGYELKAECGGSAAHASPLPDAQLLFADRAIIIDHHTGTAHLLALTTPAHEASTEAWFAAAARALTASGPVPPPSDLPITGDLTLRHDRDAYEALIDRCHEHIWAGESYEICLTNELSGEARLPIVETYRRLRATSRSPRAGLLHFGEIGVLSTSPERFLAITADRQATSKPIKGTRPRSSDPQADALMRAELQASEKERAENLMIVDLVRHDLTHTAVPGSIEVPQFLEVESYATVHQLVSTVRSQLAEDTGVVDCLRACFPGGSMTGAPKLRTMEIIDDLEAGPRGIYSGALGYFSLSGALDLSMVIRTLVITAGGFSYGVGGAITALSDPSAEFEETAVKAEPLLRLLGAQFPGRDRKSR